MTQIESFDDSHAITLSGTGPGVSNRVLKPGEIIGGSYKLKSLLGHGGMGYVFCAEHTMIKHDYALKMLAPEQLNEVSRRRFEIEGRAIAKLDHPNIVKVYNMGLDAGDCPFYVMDLLDGTALSDYISARHGLPFEECLDIVSQIASGLGYAHRKGIVHRDVKPSNVILLSEAKDRWHVKIVDFGIAKLLPSANLHSQSQTATGEVFGSPLYMSPEQCMGDPVDLRSDIYSLGCTLFESLCGQPPYHGQNAMETVMMHQNQPIPSILEVKPDQHLPQSVDILLAKMMAKRPQDRYQSMAQLMHDLGRVKQGKPIGKLPAASAAPTRADQAPGESTGKFTGTSAGKSTGKSTDKATGQFSVDTEAEVEAGRLNEGGRGGHYRAVLFTFGVIVLVGCFCLVAWRLFPTSRKSTVSPPPAAIVKKDNAGPGPTKKAALVGSHGFPGGDPNRLALPANLDTLRVPADTGVEEAGKVFEKFGPIKSTMVTINQVKQKKFVFPTWPIGSIYSNGSGSKTACGDVYLPADKPLLLEIGNGRSRHVLQFPEIVDKIDPSEFQALAVVGRPASDDEKEYASEFGGIDGLESQAKKLLGTSGAHGMESDSGGLLHILKAAAKWPNLNNLRIDSLPITEEALGVINDFRHLRIFQINRATINLADLAKQPFLSDLEGLTLSRMYRGDKKDLIKPICDRLATCPHLQKLEITDCHASAADLQALAPCLQLRALALQETNFETLVPAVIQLSSVQYIFFKKAELKPKQIKSITACKNIRRLFLSKDSFTDKQREQYRYGEPKVSFLSI